MADKRQNSSRKEQTIERLRRFDEILRFAAVDPDIPDLPVKRLEDEVTADADNPDAAATDDHDTSYESDRRHLIKLLELDAITEKDARKRGLHELAVVYHLIRAAWIWHELRLNNVVAAFEDLQGVLKDARNGLARFTVEPWRDRKHTEKGDVARYLVAALLEKQESQRAAESLWETLETKGKLRPLRETSRFDAARYAVTANIARRWYCITGAVPPNLSYDQLHAIGCAPPLPTFYDQMDYAFAPYSSKGLQPLVEPLLTSSVARLRDEIATLKDVVDAALDAYPATRKDTASASVRPNDALALGCAMLFAKHRGGDRVVTYPESAFADFVRTMSRLTALDGNERFPQDIIEIILKGRRTGRFTLDAFETPGVPDPDF